MFYRQYHAPVWLSDIMQVTTWMGARSIILCMINMPNWRHQI